MSLQYFLAEPSPNLTNSLIFFGISVVARKKECAVDVRAFTFAVVTSYDY